MLGAKNLRPSVSLFAAIVIANSFFYMLYNFQNNDVEQAVQSFGSVQLIILTVAMLFLILNIWKLRLYFLWGFYLFSGLLVFIQIVPAFLWILFNGQTVAERPYESGITGHWIFGAYHILVMVWGALNMIGCARISKPNKPENRTIPTYIPIFMCVFMSLGVLIGICFANVAIGVLMGTGIGLLLGVLLDTAKKRKVKAP